MKKEFLHKDETYKIIGACFKVYNQLGHGFLEAVYQEALELEFSRCGIPFRPQEPIQIFYSEVPLKQKYIPDFICYDKIILELKACHTIDESHRAQLFNYLKATKLKVGYVINFGAKDELQYERIICS
ncbi:GxxExxY protein [Lentisphaera marina]|uniref:GxxExxY protein n=1 Tax=Lentisphaera marina TaxID=1111041 RepID=UPI0023669BBA|nr:GxxExxY protein [Lentisphaera marina]MDD7986918.1 GxxExxY protein [Lentisphaera marina]